MPAGEPSTDSGEAPTPQDLPAIPPELPGELLGVLGGLVAGLGVDESAFARVLPGVLRGSREHLLPDLLALAAAQ